MVIPYALLRRIQAALDAAAGGGGGSGGGGAAAVTRIQATDVACPAGTPTTLGDSYLLKAGHMYAVVAEVSGTATAAGRADTTLVADADLGSTLPGTLLTPMGSGFGQAGSWGPGNDQSDVFAAPVDVTVQATTTITVDGTATLDLWIVDLGPNASGGGGSGIAVGPIETPIPLPNLNDTVSPPDESKPYWISIEADGVWDDTVPFGTIGLNIVRPDKTSTTVAEHFSARTPDSAGFLATLTAILAPGERWQVTGPEGYVSITRVAERALA